MSSVPLPAPRRTAWERRVASPLSMGPCRLLRVGRAGGSLKLSPTVELFVYDDEDGPNSRRGLAPGSVRENRD